jgi:tripartite ATP-independent transporter DctM subunit
VVELSPETVVIIMFSAGFAGIFIGYPLAIILAGIGMAVGLVVMGPSVFSLFHVGILNFLSDYTYLAAPLFVFMGIMVERSGSAERLYGGLHVLFGGLRGGLAIGTILMGTILAACVGVVAASVAMIGLIAAPNMLKRGYNKELICGSICAGGTLGILIPPSIMLVIYGPSAGISVGKLFMAAFIPGLILTGLYICYVAITCWFKPQLAPPISAEERNIPLLSKVRIFVLGILPPLFLILAVLGSIFFGFASPTEAAAVGCVAAVILAIAYRQFNWQILKETMLQTIKITSMVYLIGWGAVMFTGVLLRLGGDDVVANVIMLAPGGKWGILATIMFIVFILGMFVEWVGIIFVMIPIIAPIGVTLGFDPLWFAMMIIVNLQMSFLTPPFAYAIFYLKALVEPGWGIETGHIIRGVIPFVVLIMVGLILLAAFPDLILWLPNMMIK